MDSGDPRMIMGANIFLDILRVASTREPSGYTAIIDGHQTPLPMVDIVGQVMYFLHNGSIVFALGGSDRVPISVGVFEQKDPKTGAILSSIPMIRLSNVFVMSVGPDTLESTLSSSGLTPAGITQKIYSLIEPFTRWEPEATPSPHHAE